MELTRTSLRRQLPQAIRLTAIVLVIVGITWAVRRALQDPAIRDLDPAALDGRWLSLAGLAYAVGTLPGWFYWHRILWRFGQRPTKLESLRAFMLGQLGKYVPGKGMVVAIRADAVRSFGEQVGEFAQVFLAEERAAGNAGEIA